MKSSSGIILADSTWEAGKGVLKEKGKNQVRVSSLSTESTSTKVSFLKERKADSESSITRTETSTTDSGTKELKAEGENFLKQAQG